MRVEALIRAGWKPADGERYVTNERRAVFDNDLWDDGSLFAAKEEEVLGAKEARARRFARAAALAPSGRCAKTGYEPFFLESMPRCREPLLAVPAAVAGDARLEDLPDGVFDSVIDMAGLTSSRAVACGSSALRYKVCLAMCRKTSLTIPPADVSFCNAAFASRLPALERIHVAGETQFPELNIVRLRTLPRIKIQRMQWGTALFLGAALAGGDHVVRLSSICRPESHMHTLELASLASVETLWLGDMPHVTRPDIALMLGSLSANGRLKSIRLRNDKTRVRDEGGTWTTLDEVLTAAGLTIPKPPPEEEEEDKQPTALLIRPNRCFVTGSRHLADRCLQCGGCEHGTLVGFEWDPTDC